MKFEGLTPHSSVGVQTKLVTCLIHQNKSVSKLGMIKEVNLS